jgi:hypothetical protein
MPGLRPIVFDTNACQDLSVRFPDTLDEVIDAISGNYHIWVSPNTLIEILAGVTGAKAEQHFQRDRRKLMVLTGNNPLFLPMPFTFVLETCLKRNGFTVSQFGPSDFKKWVDTVIAADTFSPETPTTLAAAMTCDGDGFNFNTIKEGQEEGWQQHFQMIEDVRNGKTFCEDPAIYAHLLAHSVGLELANEDAERVSEGIDLHHRYLRILIAEYGDPNVNKEKRRGDWLDLMQLHYLADSEVRLITSDDKLVNFGKVQAADRIVSLDLFLVEAGITTTVS